MYKLKKFQDFALYLFAFSLSFEYWDAFGLKNFSIGAMTGYLYAFSFILNPKFRIDGKESRKYLIPLLLFFIILTFSSAINYTYASAISWFNMSIFQCVVLFILISMHLKNRGLKVANKMLFSYVLGSMLLTILYGFGLGVEYSADMRLTIFGLAANGLGFNSAITLLVIISLVIENKLGYGKKRYLLLLILPLLLKQIAETGSRGAFVALAVGLIVFIFFIKMKRGYKILFFAVGIISVYGMFQYMLQTDVFKSRLQLTIETGDTSDRTEIWSRVIPLFTKNPILGMGETGYNRYAKIKLVEYQGVHNVFIEVLIYTGIVGFILYLMVLYQIYRKSLFLYRYFSYLLPIVLLSMILMLFLNGQGLFVKLVWLIFAYTIGLAQIYKIEPNMKNKFVLSKTD